MRERETARATLVWMSVEVVSGVRIVQCHAIIDVVIDVRVMLCHHAMDVVIGVRVMLCHQAIDNSGFSTFLNFPLRVQILILLSSCMLSSSLFPVAIFVHTFAPRKRHFRCGIYKKRHHITTKTVVLSASVHCRTDLFAGKEWKQTVWFIHLSIGRNCWICWTGVQHSL